VELSLTFIKKTIIAPFSPKKEDKRTQSVPLQYPVRTQPLKKKKTWCFMGAYSTRTVRVPVPAQYPVRVRLAKRSTRASEMPSYL
jgi:predicted AlkP superfamily phosphohydrolase/phosphomutase